MLQKIWNDEAGAILSAEVVLVGTILVIGVLTGLTSLRDAVVTELADVGEAIGSLDQSYFYGGTVAHHSTNYGTEYFDCHDSCDLADTGGAFHNSRCLAICVSGNPGECGHNQVP